MQQEMASYLNFFPIRCYDNNKKETICLEQ